MMPLACLYTVPPAQMRYVDVGDWHYSHKGLEIRVPRGLSNDETLLVMVHELVESFMVRRDGVHEAAVNAFDQAHADADEAGALSAAPTTMSTPRRRKWRRSSRRCWACGGRPTTGTPIGSTTP
jgi:hypothetical protein